MSHSIHVFLVNNYTDLGQAMLIVDNTLVESLPDTCDYFRVLGAIDLHKDEYKEWMNTVGENWSQIKSKSDLEAFANKLYSQEIWNHLKAELERAIKNESFFTAKYYCERLDGINYAKSMGFPKWSADPDKAFAINDGYYDMSGISDWRTIQDLSEAEFESEGTYAVIVDFHS